MRKSFLFRVFLIVVIGVIVLISVNLHRAYKVEQYLAVKTINIKQEYTMIYNIYKDISYNTFYGIINKKRVLKAFSKASEDKNATRAELFSILKDDYKHLRELNFHQIHFHLPNNDSFLRMHVPLEFGDNLSKDRYSVSFVNRYKKPIDGFEEGKVIHGFRFVYPLFYKNIHIGSVEASIDSNAFKKKFEENFNAHVHFLIDKSVVHKKVFKSHWDNYIPSIESDRFLYTKKSYESDVKKGICIDKTQVEDDCFENIDQILISKKATSIYKTFDKYKKIISVIPIENVEKETVAFFIVYSDGSYIYELNQTYYLIMFSLFLLFMLFIAFQYLEVKRINDLHIAVEDALSKQRNQQEILERQSKLAQMGELLSMIAHQWRQPLNAISAISSHMKIHYVLDDSECTHKEELESFKKIDSYVQHLSKTIDDFRNFYKPTKVSESVRLEIPVRRAVNILKNDFNKFGISLELTNLSKSIIKTYSSELTQVMLNILTNAKEQFIKEKIADRKIGIILKEDDEIYTIIITDSAGGASENTLKNMFDMNFSTKMDDKGTGLGLHMSKIIIEDHCKGSISAKNVDKGLEFTITLKSL